MLYRLRLPLFILVCFPGSSSLAQCPGCQINFGCSATPPYPTLCPVQPPDATAGVPYQTDITFWLPDNFTDTQTGFNVDFMLMTITGVSGLPFGLGLETNDALGVYHPQMNQYGCARICGTPIGAGTFTVTINIIAQVVYSGFTLNVPKQFPITLVVQPGSGSNTGFSFTPSSGCGSADVQFNALIDGGGQPVSYAWDFGNGNTGTADGPAQTYNSPGTYSISLQTTIGGYVLNTVNVGGVNDNWCGDVEEISLFGSCQGAPDIYFVLTDGQGNTYTSSSGSDSNSETWNSLNITLGNPPYAIEFWDEDPISVDDALGTYNIPLAGEGDYPFNVAGGTFGSLHIDLVPQQVFNDTDTVVVFAIPQPVLAYDTLGGSICVSDTGLVNVTWFNDGDTVHTVTPFCVNADSSGTWWAVVINGFGCTSMSDTVLICPAITIQQSGIVLYTETGLTSYAWSLDGVPIGGEDGPFLIASSGGNYTVTATNADGCTMTAAYLLVMTGVGPVTPPDHVLQVFPVPNDGRFTVRTNEAGILEVMDAHGREVFEHAVSPSLEEGDLLVDLRDATPGNYFVRLLASTGGHVQRISIAH